MGVFSGSLMSRIVAINAIRVVVGVVLVVGVALNTKFLVESSAELDRRHQVVEQILVVEGQLSRLVVAVQDYLGTGGRSELGVFYSHKESLVREKKTLMRLLVGQPEQQARVEKLQFLVEAWLRQEVEPAIVTRQTMDPLAPATQMSGTVLRSDSQLSTLLVKLSNLAADEKQQLVKQQREARETAETARLVIISLAVVLVVFGVVFSLVVMGGIPRRLRQLVGATQSLTAGDIDVSIVIDSNDEVGVLSQAFEQMLARIRHVVEVSQAVAEGDFSKQVQVQSDDDRLAIAINQMSQSLERSAEERRDQDWLSAGEAELLYKMSKVHEVVPLSQLVITQLARHLKAQVGVFYLAEKQRLRLVSSYAYQKRNNNDSELSFGEGLIGQAALERQAILYSQVPEAQNPLTINDGLGESQPLDVIVLPLVHEGGVEAVLALGVNRKYSAAELAFLDKVAQSIAINIHVTRTHQQLGVLLEESKLQSEELQTQQEELKAANEELEEHAAMQARSEESLRTKSAELQQLNTELEERTEALERQKNETETINREINEAKLAVERQAKTLARASQYKSEFLANMSHELRTPLNSLLILSQALSKNRSGNLTEEQVEDARVIYQGGKSLLGLINDILDLSKVEAGKLDIRFEAMVIDEMLATLQNQFAPIASEKGLALLLEKDDTLPATLYTDSLRVEQVLRNLLSNAVKFTAEGSVKLRVYRAPAPTTFNNADLEAGAVLAFAVSDTGIGIPEDKHQGVFEAFQQADGSTSRTYGGTGLGLTISRELVKLLGGEIQLESREGEGSTFTLYLPLLNATPVEVVPALAQASAAAGGAGASLNSGSMPGASSKPGMVAAGDRQPALHKPQGIPVKVALQDDREALVPGVKSVLIIEDDRSFAKILAELSRKKGYQTLVAETGSSGLQLAEEYLPSAIVLDLGLPDISGRQVLEQLKTNIQTRHIPVHVLSAEDRDHKVLQMGAIGFLTKPVSDEVIDELFGSIEALLQDTLKRVLLVEDDSGNRQAVMRLIASQDVEICAVGTGQQAYEALLSGGFDCVILDLSLPDISGFELLDQLSQDPRISLPPVVVYTGRELTGEEYKQLSEYTSSIVIKGASSPERLLDETTLFLHSVEANLPESQRDIIRLLHSQEQLLQGRKVLLVDDDLRNTYALSKVLRDHGLEVVMADNGQLALEKLAQEEGIELVLMDIMMPVMDGYEAMRKIRQQPNWKKLPIIALTAKAMAEDRMKSIEAGANDYCAKPVDVDRLISMMRVWLFK